ncbi:hypothetical protein RU639_004232 [Aspergillus parasiticus]
MFSTALLPKKQLVAFSPTLRHPLSKAEPSPSRAPDSLPAFSCFKTLASGRNGQRPIDKIQAQQGRLASF